MCNTFPDKEASEEALISHLYKTREFLMPSQHLMRDYLPHPISRMSQDQGEALISVYIHAVAACALFVLVLSLLIMDLIL